MFKNDDVTLYYELLLDLYSVDEEAYEERLEADFVWQLPYTAIEEFIKPVAFVFKATFGLEETLAFIDYYYNRQDGYDKNFRISETEYKLICLVVKEEITRGQFCSSCGALEECEKFVSKKCSKRAEFMLKISQKFLKRIKSGSLNKEFKLFDQIDDAHERDLRYTKYNIDDFEVKEYDEYYYGVIKC